MRNMLLKFHIIHLPTRARISTPSKRIFSQCRSEWSKNKMISTIQFSLLIITTYITLGVGKVPTKIIGGSTDRMENFPHLVSVRKSNFHVCTGNLIGTRHVLSAAHCFVSVGNVIDYGSQIASDYKTHGWKLTRIRMIVIHENYRGPSEPINDIAVLVLQTPISSRLSTRRPVPYYSVVPLPGTILMFGGWGNANGTAVYGPEALGTIEVMVLGHEECEYYSGQSVSSGTMCTKTREGQHTSGGDSGGGLFSNGKIVGILAGKSLTTRIQFFINVPFFEEWIGRTISRF